MIEIIKRTLPMGSTNAYKYLLFVLGTSQLLLLMIFWKHALPLLKNEQEKREKRNSCDCKDNLRNEEARFHRINSNTSREGVVGQKIFTIPTNEHGNETFARMAGSEIRNNSERPTLFVAIVSAREYIQRRQAVRETWMQDCDANRNVVCKFFTDAQNGFGDPIDERMLDKLYDESAKNRGDLVLLNTASGTNFALRLLALLEWASKSIKFDFLLRIDDDHFLCLDRLLAELPYRPRNRLYWGYVHCHQGIVRIDEGMVILTADLIQEFLQDKDELLCHKFGDQAMAMWIYRAMKKRPVTWFGDARVHHDPPASHVYEFTRREEICHTFISLHGSYPTEMRQFWEVTERERRRIGTEYVISPILDACPFRRDNFNWMIMSKRFRAIPRPCKEEPIWVSERAYQGRASNNLPAMPAAEHSVKVQRVDLRYLGTNKSAWRSKLFGRVK